MKEIRCKRCGLLKTTIDSTSQVCIALSTDNIPPHDFGEETNKTWKEELFDISEKYCKHDDRDLNSCLYHILEPVIQKALLSQSEKIEAEMEKDIEKLENQGYKQLSGYKDAIRDLKLTLSKYK